MIIERSFSNLVVLKEDSILTALNKMSGNKARIIFAVSELGVLEGVMTDGDFRRWLTTTSEIDLNKPVSLAMNRHFQYAHVNSDHGQIRSMLSSKVLAVPLLDDKQRLVAVALPFSKQCEIEGKTISENSPAFIIAEIGNNHNGDLALAMQLIDAAAEAGADCVKFQMRDLSSLYRNEGKSDDDSADLGAQYTLDLLSRFQLSDQHLLQAFDHCREKGLVPLCTPWDTASLAKLQAYGLPAYKIASADFTNYDLIDAVAEVGKPMICSTGMATEHEIHEGIRHLNSLGAFYILLHCNSSYPAPFKDVNLQYINHLKELSQALVGYSGHERDIHVAIAAIGFGAKVIEKHFTLDRKMEGNDHKISLLPAEFAKMVEGIRQVEEAVGTVNERSLTQGEVMNRENLAKSLVAAMDIPAGIKIVEEMIEVRSPGQGIQPNRKKDLIGRILQSDKKAGDFFYPNDLGNGKVVPRQYTFKRPWGIPVRYHDLNRLRHLSNMDLLEIHLSYKDMEFDYRQYLAEPLSLGLVIHAPELFSGDHTLDLCSQDAAYRARSLKEMQRVIDLTRELKQYFTTERPCIITNVGGFSHKGHLPASAREKLYQTLQKSISSLDMAGVEVIPQTMPPFPWHFGGQQFHNIFVTAESIAGFCQKNDMRICFDVSHSKLACNHLKTSFSEFVKQVGPYVAHMHLADAKGVDGEGLQIGEGEMDWPQFAETIGQCAPKASFIPEIWQGHKNDGEGAWLALEKLEALGL